MKKTTRTIEITWSDNVYISIRQMARTAVVCPDDTESPAAIEQENIDIAQPTVSATEMTEGDDYATGFSGAGTLPPI